MARLVDIDKVLECGCLSKRAIAKINELPSHPAISYEAKTIWDEMHREGTEAHYLGALMLCAFRYAVNRHPTACLTRCDMDEIILANLNLMCDDFIYQMICDIHKEWFMWSISDKKELFGDPMYLKPFHDALQEEYIKRGYNRIPDDERF